MRPPEATRALPHQIEVLHDLEPVVGELLQTHEAKRKLWWPSDLLGISESETPDRDLAALRDRARGIPDPVRISLVMGLVTEEGLPHFHRLIAVHMGDNTYWREWNNLWTAEEDRHGAVLHDYLWEARIVQPRIVEEMQFQYIRNGFYPGWEYNPYRLLAYTSLQERATQICHANNGKAAGQYDPLIGRVLERVATEEARHFHFYRSVFTELLARDPDHALAAAENVILNFEMPGGSMPGFREMTDAIRRSGLYGPRDFLRIVEEQIEHWKIASLSGLNEVGRKSQDVILGFPQRLKRIIEHMESRASSKTFSFELVYQREFALE